MYATPDGGTYPVRLELDAPLEVARWRPLVNWLLAIPQFIVLYALGAVLGILQFVAFFTVLFTKQIPRGMFDFMAMTLRYQWRVASYIFFMRESYPPFDFTGASEDPGGDPATLSVDYPQELRRFMPLVKWLLAIPQYFVLFFLGIAAYVAGFIAFFAVLITGRWPEGMHRFVIGVIRWSTRVSAYVYLMRDEYPPFALD
jgi:roadblock/LC7 domain-containing protein